MSPKHLNLYVREFATRHNSWDLNVLDRIGTFVVGMDREQFRYLDLTADKVVISGALV